MTSPVYLHSTSCKVPNRPFPPPIHKIPGHGGHGQNIHGTTPSKLGKYWFASDFKDAVDVRKILHNDIIRHGNFTVRVISWYDEHITGDTVIIGIQTSYESIVDSKMSDRIIWGPKGISLTTDDYRNGTYLSRKP